MNRPWDSPVLSAVFFPIVREAVRSGREPVQVGLHQRLAVRGGIRIGLSSAGPAADLLPQWFVEEGQEPAKASNAVATGVRRWRVGSGPFFVFLLPLRPAR